MNLEAAPLLPTSEMLAGRAGWLGWLAGWNHVECSMTNEELIKYDLKREEREAAKQSKRIAPPSQTISLNKSSFSKGLIERFGHLLGDQQTHPSVCGLHV